MTLYLVQHGDAVAKSVDPDRPLSETGRNDCQMMASFLSPSRTPVARILHSGKTRARETAELMALGLGAGIMVEQASFGIAPNDPTDALTNAANAWSEDVMVVGHQPFMGRMVSRLICGSENCEVLQFSPGSVAALLRTQEDGGIWTLAWFLRPDLMIR